MDILKFLPQLSQIDFQKIGRTILVHYYAGQIISGELARIDENIVVDNEFFFNLSEGCKERAEAIVDMFLKESN